MELNTFPSSRSRDSPKFELSLIQPLLCDVDEKSPDVLLLYDSCHPANGQGSTRSGRSVIELLAATGFESIAPEVGRDSFTNCLIQELSAAAGQRKGISIPELHSRQICRLQSGDQRSVMLGRDRDGRMRVRTNGSEAIFETPRRRTPIHCQLSLNDRPRAIVLSPLAATTTDGAEFIELGNSCGIKTAVGSWDSAPQLQALLRVSIAEDEFNETEFKDWLCSAPAAARGIRVMGIWPSCSTMLLLRVPIEVWDLLPPSPAVSFVAFVWGDASTASQASLSAITSGAEQQLTKQTTDVAASRKGKEIDTTSLENSSTELASTEMGFDVELAIKSSNADEETPRISIEHSEDDARLVDILNAVDAALPDIFRRVRAATTTSNSCRDLTVKREVLTVLGLQASGPEGDPRKLGSINRNVLLDPEVCIPPIPPTHGLSLIFWIPESEIHSQIYQHTRYAGVR